MKIVFTKRVVFRDWLGNVLKTFEVGDTTEFSVFNGVYYVTSMGGIWSDEAKIILD
jgi:hypothetical protein